MSTAKIMMFITILMLLLSSSVLAQDKDKALESAKNILSLLSKQEYKTIWDSHMSSYFKNQTTRDSFLANMTIGRSRLGDLVKTKLIDISFAKKDPLTGYSGKIYYINFLNTYTVGKFYEQIVVLKEDGQFQLSGYWANPAPPQ